MERLLRRRDFLSAAKGRFVPQSGVLVQARDRQDEKPPRVGFTCTKKLGNAVMRNRIRRRLKEAARLALPAVARTGFDYVLIGREASATRGFEALQNDIISAVSKLHAAKPASATRTGQ
ncbi:MAG: ribonuclease P protein component [Rhizobiales bacterium]|nr:ribonuclease P protein component [Hyphomicrobiales bacterium]